MSSGLFSVLQAMHERDRDGHPHLLRDSEALLLDAFFFRSALRGLEPFLIQKLGNEGLADAKGSLWEWFLEDPRSGGGREPIWRRAWLAVYDDEPSVRDAKLAGYLTTAARNWLRKHFGGSGAVFHQLVSEALKEEIFVLSSGAKQVASYTLRQWSFPEDPSFDAGALGRSFPRRRIKRESLSGRSLARLPPVSEIRDALADGMYVAERAFTVDQAKAFVRYVFGISRETEPVSLDEGVDSTDAPATRQSAEASEGIGSENTERGTDAIVAEIERQDRLPAGRRPTNSREGRVARYLLDFEIWDGWPLQEHPILETILSKAGKDKPDVSATEVYDLVLFEAWSGVPDSSVSDWRKERRGELLAQALVAGLAWSAPAARNYFSTENSGKRAHHPEVLNLLQSVFWQLRSKFLHRKPEFVSEHPFAKMRTMTGDDYS
jgi:hypothetical protein